MTIVCSSRGKIQAARVDFSERRSLAFYQLERYLGSVKIRIEMARQHYDSLLNAAAKDSRAYAALMSSVIFRQSESLLPNDTVITVCEDHEATAFLDLANECCPDAAFTIEQVFKNSRSA